MNLQSTLRKGLAAAGWRLPAPSGRKTAEPAVLMYHGISERTSPWGMNSDVFEEHARFLVRHFDVVGANDASNRRSNRERVAITFDDGLRNNAEVAAPILRSYGAPATFFVSTRHCEPGKYLWATYLRALEDYYPESELAFRGRRYGMGTSERADSMRRLRNLLLGLEPHPAAIYAAIEQELPSLESFLEPECIRDRCAGMTPEQVRELAEDPLFSIGAHTEDHPLLSRCDDGEIRNQLATNKRKLEAWTGEPCDAVAYPCSDLDERVIERCREAGFRHGYSAERPPRFDRSMERFRTGVYYPSLDELGCKVRWGRLWTEKLEALR